jgi:hypothetical protein
MPSTTGVLIRASSLAGALGRLLARRGPRLCFFAVLALVTVWPLLGTGDQLNLFRDAHVLFSYERNAVAAVRRFGQLPLWDPYYCGGLYALGTPQGRFASPTFLLSLAFGAARAEAVIAFVMIGLGLEGTFRYARSYGATALGAALAAPAFALSGSFVAVPFLGWTNFYGFQLVPWALVGARGAMGGRLSGALVLAVALAWIVGFGGTYAGPMTALAVAWEVGLGLIRRRAPLRTSAGLVALAAALFVGLGAVRVWPLVETLAAAPRVLGGKPGMPLAASWTALIDPVMIRNENLASSRQMYVVGPYLMLAALAGFWRRRAWPLVLFAALAIWASTGHALGWSPFVGLRALPIFSSLRYPERYLILAALALAVIAAVGVTTLQALARRRPLWIAGTLLAAAALLATVTFLVSDHHVVAARRVLAPAAPVLERDFRQARGNRWALSYYAPMDRGSIACWEAYPVPQSPLLRGDLPAEEYLADADADAGHVTRRRWSPNRIDLDVALDRPAELRVNQNYHPGWRASVGHVVDRQGLLAVALPAGEHHVTLRFLPRSALGGGLASLLAAAALVYLAARGRRRDTIAGRGDALRCAVAAGVPLLALLAVRLLVSEPPVPRAPPRAPNGEPILTDQLPPSARPSGEVFSDEVELVSASPGAGAELHGQRGEPLSIELDWRVRRPPRDETAVVVTLESDTGERLTADHVLLSAWTDLAHAPSGPAAPIVRDIVPLVIGRGTRGKRWTITAGLARPGAPPSRRVAVGTVVVE